MYEREARGVQRLAAESKRALPAVGGIADEWMPEGSEMHADLVRAPRLEPAREQRGRAEALDDRVMRARGLAGRNDRHRRAPRRMAPDRCLDRSAVAEVAGRERQVFAMDGTCRELTHEIGVRGQRLRDDEEPARVLVEAMDDARARHGGKPRRVMEERVLQGAATIARARMHDQARGLVDDEQRIVLVHDRKCDRLGSGRRGIGLGYWADDDT